MLGPVGRGSPAPANAGSPVASMRALRPCKCVCDRVAVGRGARKAESEAADSILELAL